MTAKCKQNLPSKALVLTVCLDARNCLYLSIVRAMDCHKKYLHKLTSTVALLDKELNLLGLYSLVDLLKARGNFQK